MWIKVLNPAKIPAGYPVPVAFWNPAGYPVPVFLTHLNPVSGSGPKKPFRLNPKFNADYEQVSCYRVTLSAASANLDSGSGEAIYQDGGLEVLQ